MREHDKALRIRKTEIEIQEPEKMEEILTELEFYPASKRVKKTRSYYAKSNMTAAADQVENSAQQTVTR